LGRPRPQLVELVVTRIADADLDACRIRITQGKGGKDRYVPFPTAFKETLALHIDTAHTKTAVFLFESSGKRPGSKPKASTTPSSSPTPATPPAPA